MIRDNNKAGKFTRDVLGVVKKIPRGKVMTYMEVASKVGRPRAYRAAGNVLNKNYDSKIPCHRVVRSDNSIGGYNRGMKTKEKLLKEESINLK